MEIINLVFPWVMVIMSIWGFFSVNKNTGQKMLFWIFFSIGWLSLGINAVYAFTGVPAEEGYMMATRVLAYIMLIISALTLMMHIIDKDSF